MSTTKKVVLGSLAALAVGAIAGILTAPEKGSTTRKQIKDKGNDYMTKLKTKSGKFSDSLKSQFESTKNDAENLAERGKETYNDAKNDVKNATSNFKRDVTPNKY